MAGVASPDAIAAPEERSSRRLTAWTIRPRQVGALLALRWRLGVRVYRRSVSAVIGLVALLIFTLSFAGAAGVLTALGYVNLPRPAAIELLFGALGLLYIAWIALPALQYSVNEGLDVTKLHTYPLSVAERMLALTLATLFDPATLIILGVFAAVVAGWHMSLFGVVVTLVALALLYTHIVGASQFTMAVLIGLLRSRRYRDLSIIIFALLSVACSLSGQFATTLVGHVGSIHLLSRLDLGRYLQWTPPGMAARAIIAANTGDALGALPWLLALLALVPALFAIWAWALDRGVTTPEGGGSGARRRGRWVSAPLAARPALGTALGASASPAVSVRRRLISPVIAAIAVKDLRYFWRDPQIKASLLSSMVLLLVVFGPSLINNHGDHAAQGYVQQHLAAYQPLLAPLPALLIVVTLSLNAFGLERQGLQSLFLTPARPLDVLWGKNLAVGLIAFLTQLVLIGAVAVVTGDWNAVPLAVIEGGAATLALLGAGNVTSTLLPLRVRQLRMGANTLSSENGCLRSVISIGTLWAMLFALLPVFILLLLPLLIDKQQWLIVSAPLALLYGLALYQIATLLVAPRLLKRGPEILAVVARDA